MKVERLKVDPVKARELWRTYREHLAYMTKADEQIAAIYKRLAQGRTVILAIESIRAAGLGPDGLPVLAIARADQTKVDCIVWPTSTRFGCRERAASKRIQIEGLGHGEGAPMSSTTSGTAAVPLIPVHLRPRTSLAAYHILWEAAWQAYPREPVPAAALRC